MTDKTRAIYKLLLLVCLIVVGNVLAQWLLDSLHIEIRPASEPAAQRILVASMAAYSILMALPFVPGAEIGIALLMVLGPKIAVLVYVCTLSALTASFLIGRFIPEQAIIELLKDLHLHKASRLLSELQDLDTTQRLQFLLKRSPKRFVPYLLKYRHLALIVAINLPGNVVIGGGGGIALTAGLSKLFSPAAFVLSVAIAVAPVPLAWLFFGESLFDHLF